MTSKLLYLLRHAKAESASADLPDQDRALTEKGVSDAQKLATKLRKKELGFDLILTSPAIRAITTAQIIAKTLDHRQHHLEVAQNLYQANLSIFLAIVAGLHKKTSRVLLVGHNPDLEEFAQLLSGESVSMQTCALIQFNLELKHWRDFETRKSVHMKIIN
jgi:phosphohistidine phosphatase